MSSSNPFDNVDNNQFLDSYGSDQNFNENDNPFDTYFKVQEKRKEEVLKQVLSLAQKKDPNRIGKAQILAKELGIPPDMALDNEGVLEILEQRKKEQEIQNLNAQDLALVNPLLAKQLRDPNFAAIAYDNIPRLQKTESILSYFKKLGQNYYEGDARGTIAREMGEIGWRLKNNGVPFISTQEGFGNLDDGSEYIPTQQDLDDLQSLREMEERMLEYDSNGIGLIEGFAYIPGLLRGGQIEAITAGVVTGKLADEATKLFTSTVGSQLVGAFTGSDGGGNFMGYGAGYAFGQAISPFISFFTGMNAYTNKMTLDMAEIEGGHQYLDARNRKANVSDAQTLANITGVSNAAIERIGFEYFSRVLKKNLPGTLKLLQPLTSPLMKKSGLDKAINRQFAKNVLSNGGRKLTYSAAARRFGRQYISNMGVEIGTELIQELNAIAGINIFSEFVNDEITPFSAVEIGDRIYNTMDQTFRSMVLFGLLPSVGGYVTDFTAATKAKKDTALLSKLSEISKDDVTKKRNKNAWQNWIQQLADQNGADTIHINAQEFKQQLDNNAITEQQLELFSPDLARQLKNAEKQGLSGKTIQIKTGDYLANISGTKFDESLKPHIKFGDDQMSQTEAAQFFKDQPEILKSMQDVVRKQKNQLLQDKEETRQIELQITKQLKALNIYKPHNARFLSQLIGNFAKTYSQYTNQTPSQFINDHFFNIQLDSRSENFGQQYFNQNGTIKTDSPLFKNWFRKSKMVNKDGTPMVLYHGTTDNIRQFDLDHPNRLDSGYLGKAIYATPRKFLAENYANIKRSRFKKATEDKKILELYVRLENPKTVNVNSDVKSKNKDGGKAAANAYKDKLINEGHDGVIMVNDSGEIIEVAVFDANAVKSVDNSGNWSNEINDIYNQQVTESFEQKATQKKGKPVSEEVFQLARILENFDFAKSKPFATNRDFKLEIQNRIQAAAKKAGVNLADFSAETEKYLVRTLLEDARFALTENANAVGWYDEKVSKAVRILSLIYPKVATDKRHEFVFKWALAATSNGIKVDKNYEYAADVYEKWLKSEEELGEGKGRLPEKMLNAEGEKTGGTARAAMEKSFKILNLLFDKKSFAELEEFMRTMHTVREVHEFVGTYKNGRQIKVGGGYGLDEQVYGAAIMGPKIGNGFFANLNGNYDQLTLDRWAMRTWGRMTGTLVLNKQKQAKIKRGQIKQIIKALTKTQKKAFEAIIGRKLTVGDIDQLAIDIEKASTTEENRDRMAEIATFAEDPKHREIYVEINGKPRKDDATVSLGDYLRKRGNLLAKDNDGQKEAPSGAPERRNIEKVFAQVLEVLQKDYPSLTMADLQALVWYPEKKLYDSAKLKEAVVETNYEDNEAPDYANAAVEFAARIGIPDEDIQSAIQEVDDELQAVEQSRRTQLDDGGRGEVRGDDGTFQQQRNIDEATGLPINPDGTVTVYHHTNRRNAERIKSEGRLRSSGEPDVYVTTRAITDTGYGDTAVAIRIDPSRLSLDDEFPNGRRDYRLSVGEPRGSIQVKVGEFAQQQDSDGARGRFQPDTLTALFTTQADFSTFAHESAHYMLTVLENIVTGENAPLELVNDFNILLDFWGVKDLETWKSFDIDQKRKYHESFAYNFEIYMYEGKAPSTALIEMFRKFSRFIKRVYTDVIYKVNRAYKAETGQDLPMLTDEVRNVMDRMLAVDEDIVQANEIYDMKGMFQTQEQSGMNDAEWTEYTAALEEAENRSIEIMTQKSMRQVRWLNNKREKVRKALDKKILKLRQKIEKEELEKLKQDPVYKVQSFLKRGETFNDKGELVKTKGMHKLSIDSIKNLIPFYDETAAKADIKKLGTGQNGMVRKNGLDAKVVADMFGFASGESLVNALLEIRPIQDVVKERADHRMLEEHSDLIDDKQLELQVQEAIHNEARARFIAVELGFLTKAMQPVRYQVAAAKQVAKDILADMKLSEIRPSVFTRAEANALKEAEKAMKRKDADSIRDAVQAKRSQLLNNQLAKEAIEIQKQYRKQVTNKDSLFNKFFGSDKKLFKKGKSQRNSDLVSAGRAILSSYGIGPIVENPNVYIEKIKEYDEYMYEELKPMIEDTQATEGQADITDLTYEEFLNLNDLMESLWHQSLRQNQIRLAGELLDLQPIIDTLNKRMDAMISRSKRLSARAATPIGTTQGVPKKYVFYKDILAFFSKLKRMEGWVDMMDGAQGQNQGFLSAVLELKDGKLGDFYNTLWFPMRSALDKYRVDQTIYTKEYSDLVGAVDFGNEEIVANEFAMVSEDSSAYKFGAESNGRGKVELLGAMLHTGNASNLKKLLLGRKWGKLNEDGTLNTTNWDAFVERMINEGHLTKNDFDFLQAVWDLTEKMKPLLQQAHKETEGYYFKEVKATPIINRFGEYRGGYVPAKGDPNMTEVDLQEEINTIKNDFKNSLPKVENGMTKSRNEQFAQPLSLHLGYMTKHIDDTLRYAYIQPVIQDTLKVLKNKEFAKKVDIIDPTVMKEMIMPWLKSAATQRTYAPSVLGPRMDKIIQTNKRRTGMGIMFGNLPNAFQQLTGLFPALVKVKPRHLLHGIFEYMKDREGTMQKIALASPFMADRQKNLIFDIQGRLNELLIDPNKFQQMQSWSKNHAYFLQQTFQGITDAIVWIGTVNQVHEKMPTSMSNEEVMAEAIKQADANVRLTQDSLLPEDRAAFQNMDPIVQSLTQFTGYFNMIANLGFNQYQKLVKNDLGFKNKGKNTEQFVYLYLYTTVMPAIVAGIIMRGLGGRLDEDKNDDGYIHDDVAKAFLGDIISYQAGLIPVVGQLALIPINAQNDIPWDDDIVSSPGIEALQDSLRVIVDLPKTIFEEGPEGVTGKQIRDVSTMVTQASGIPFTPLGRTFGYLRDVQRGYVEPKGPIDFIRGAVTGKVGTGK